MQSLTRLAILLAAGLAGSVVFVHSVNGQDSVGTSTAAGETSIRAVTSSEPRGERQPSDVPRRREPGDDVIVRLPGPDPEPVKEPPRQATLPAPAPPQAPAPPAVIEAPPVSASIRPPAGLSQTPPPLAAPRITPPRPPYPEEMKRDSAVYLQRRLGRWTEPQAREVLGTPLRQREARDADGKVDGTIFAFRDPTRHYREFELDFDLNTGQLRSVFVYPWRLTWDECRRQWGAAVQATSAQNGRTFYSYINRRLDVLVDGSGQVISLGLY